LAVRQYLQDSPRAAKRARPDLEPADQALFDSPGPDSPELDLPPIGPLALPELDWRV
jgi:hypothetical protein